MNQMINPRRELVQHREDTFAAEAFLAAEKTPPPNKLTIGDVNPEGRVGLCMCCAGVKVIPPKMHVCLECFNDLEATR